MRLAWLLVALVAGACTQSGPKPVPYAECPTGGLFHEVIPLFPGTELAVQHATTRGWMDTSIFWSEIDAPYGQVLEFYVRCLGTRASIAGTDASFARPVLGDVWVQGDQAAIVMGEPGDMSHKVMLRQRSNGSAMIRVFVAYPWGMGRGTGPTPSPAQP